MPKAVADKLISLQRRFLWSKEEGRYGLALVKWELVQAPKKVGGLGVGDAVIRNTALLFKWWWRFSKEECPLWKKVICSCYDLNPNVMLSAQTLPTRGGPWKDICQLQVMQSETLPEEVTIYSFTRTIWKGLVPPRVWCRWLSDFGSSWSIPGSLKEHFKSWTGVAHKKGDRNKWLICFFSDVLKAISLKQKWDLNDLRVLNSESVGNRRCRSRTRSPPRRRTRHRSRSTSSPAPPPPKSRSPSVVANHHKLKKDEEEKRRLRKKKDMAFLAAVFILPAGSLFILLGLIVNAMQIQESDEARKKFSNAKSLSSSQFFGDQNKAADVAAQATLSKFSGSSAISSAVHTLDFPRVLRLAKLSNNGVVLLCKNMGFSFSSLKWRNLLGGHGSSGGVFLCAYVEKGWRFHNQHLILNFLKGLAVEISQPALEIFQLLTVLRTGLRLSWSLSGGGGSYEQFAAFRRTYKIGGCDLSSTAPPCTRWIEMMAHIFSRAAWHCVWYMIQVD
ncbi:ADP-ribosylation factor GTPase-activating protein [Arachis hypogaea]|nr:ADP-ribosylation factor GTPase-activating protein [Arachis hypogaea]